MLTMGDDSVNQKCNSVVCCSTFTLCVFLHRTAVCDGDFLFDGDASCMSFFLFAIVDMQ